MKVEMISLQYFKGESIKSNNTGHYPLQPKYKKTFFDSETSSCWSVTDLDIKKQKRTNTISEFKNAYSRLYYLKKVSLFTAVVNQAYYDKIGKFINTITRKFKRKGISKLGHVWVRDIGDVKFVKHFHVLLATDYLNKDSFNEIFMKKKHSKYEIQYVKTVGGISNYLVNKELFASRGERAYQKSRCFSKPKAN